VAAGAIAAKILNYCDIKIVAYIKEIGGIRAEVDPAKVTLEDIQNSLLFCPDTVAEQKIIHMIEQIKKQGDSLGGIVEVAVTHLPAGLGDPVYCKIEAFLANAFMSIPASKGFEIGSGFMSASMLGSEHNDAYLSKNEKIFTETNHAGGALGGITTGMPLVARVCFKPASSIKKSQKTVNLAGESAELKMPEGSRHDPCVAIRAVPVVEAMTSLVIADCLLTSQADTIEKLLSRQSMSINSYK
jgi:chorismate synthase